MFRVSFIAIAQTKHIRVFYVRDQHLKTTQLNRIRDTTIRPHRDEQPQYAHQNYCAQNQCRIAHNRYIDNYNRKIRLRQTEHDRGHR